ncbi:hypothetical protein GE061_003402 [Apolygus lucorum]|uniref:Regulatory protein zeste n=1 Tax=Apolygus lucorum TaxID=248454 RepID=A0A8S9X1F7_APOLU|nr:hypothetical protein GE061_003402 [Apolygus lucorum]
MDCGDYPIKMDRAIHDGRHPFRNHVCAGGKHANKTVSYEMRRGSIVLEQLLIYPFVDDESFKIPMGSECGQVIAFNGIRGGPLFTDGCGKVYRKVRSSPNSIFLRCVKKNCHDDLKTAWFYDPSCRRESTGAMKGPIWVRVTREYNKRTPTGVQRDILQLKIAYKNMKKLARQRVAAGPIDFEGLDGEKQVFEMVCELLGISVTPDNINSNNSSERGNLCKLLEVGVFYEKIEYSVWKSSLPTNTFENMSYVKLRQLLTKSALNELVPDHFSLNDSNSSPRSGSNATPAQKSYKYKEGLYTHKRFACGKDPQFQCPYCTYRAYHKGNLKLHVGKNHPEYFEMSDAKFEENGSYHHSSVTTPWCASS